MHNLKDRLLGDNPITKISLAFRRGATEPAVINKFLEWLAQNCTNTLESLNFNFNAVELDVGILERIGEQTENLRDL